MTTLTWNRTVVVLTFLLLLPSPAVAQLTSWSVTGGYAAMKTANTPSPTGSGGGPEVGIAWHSKRGIGFGVDAFFWGFQDKLYPNERSKVSGGLLSFSAVQRTRGRVTGGFQFTPIGWAFNNELNTTAITTFSDNASFVLGGRASLILLATRSVGISVDGRYYVTVLDNPNGGESLSTHLYGVRAAVTLARHQ